MSRTKEGDNAVIKTVNIYDKQVDETAELLKVFKTKSFSELVRTLIDEAYKQHCTIESIQKKIEIYSNEIDSCKEIISKKENGKLQNAELVDLVLDDYAKLNTLYAGKMTQKERIDVCMGWIRHSKQCKEVFPGMSIEEIFDIIEQMYRQRGI